MRQLNWKWLAGFFEGEGCAGCYYDKTRKYYYLYVTIAQKEKYIINEIKKFLKFKQKLGIDKRSDVYRLSFRSQQARYFLNKIIFYCKSKKKIKQIQKALKLDKKYVKPRKTK